MIKMATNYARASYTEIYDIQTIPDTPTVLGVHTPDIKRPYKMLGGFFKQFSKFRYAGCDISFVPVATMPLDPLQVGLEAGQTAPQDVVNPILHKAFMGESLGAFFDTYFPQFDLRESVDFSNYKSTMGSAFERVYYQALSDTHFLKSGIQQGFTRNDLVPLVRRVNTNMQFGPYANRDAYDPETSTGDIITDGVELNNSSVVWKEIHETISAQGNSVYQSTRPSLFSSGAYPLDWLDTQTRVGVSSDGAPAEVQGYAWLPKLYMYFIMLPPSASTVMYFRMVVRHKFEFKDFQTLVPFGFTVDINDDFQNDIEPFEAL